MYNTISMNRELSLEEIFKDREQANTGPKKLKMLTHPSWCSW